MTGHGEGDSSAIVDPVSVVDLSAMADESGGAIWSLAHGGDLDANLVRLEPDAGVGEHVNNDVDVLLVARSGDGTVTIDGSGHPLGPDHVALIPRGAARSITAGRSGFTYMSVHRRRSPLTINPKPQRAAPTS